MDMEGGEEGMGRSGFGMEGHLRSKSFRHSRMVSDAATALAPSASSLLSLHKASEQRIYIYIYIYI
jgi:hypothetical protein